MPRQKRRLPLRAAFGVAVLARIVYGVQGGSAQQHPSAPITFDEVYRQGQQINANLKTLTARFTEATTSSLLTRPLIARGIVAVERPARMVLRYEDPEPRVILIEGNRMTLVWPGRNIRQARDVGAVIRRVQKYFVEGTLADLKKEFEVTASVSPDRAGTYELLMVPKRKQIRDGLAGLDLWIDQSSMLLTAMRMRFVNGDSKLMTFEDITINGEVDPRLFVAR